MRFKEENWQPTIGDKYDIANFDGMTFVWPKLEEITTFKELNKLCRPEPVHFVEVHQNPVIGEVSAELDINKFI